MEVGPPGPLARWAVDMYQRHADNVTDLRALRTVLVLAITNVISSIIPSVARD